jgi:hypothetical protein
MHSCDGVFGLHSITYYSVCITASTHICIIDHVMFYSKMLTLLYAHNCDYCNLCYIHNSNRKKLNAIDEDKAGLFPAINLLNDPQGCAEKVFKRLRSSNERFEVKLLMMNFISRVIGGHQLLMLPFYSFLQKYIQSHQVLHYIMPLLLPLCALSFT